MSSQNGGPAFPIPRIDTPAGMSLRDYMASSALASIVVMKFPLSDIGYSMKNGKSIMENYAACAYALADVMIAERSK